jgi:hypothetical protein
MMKINNRFFVSLFTTVLFLVICSHVSASVVWVENITATTAMVEVYNTASGFNLDNLSTTTASAGVFGSVGPYRYIFDNASVDLTPCALKDELSSSPVAKASFYGGATLTITGDIYDRDTETTFLTDITILQGQMVISSSETWILEEDPGTPKNFDGSVDFVPTNGGLTTGITLPDGDVLKIGNFNCDFSFTSFLPSNPDNFSVPMIRGLPINLQITAVPEPCTILLIAVGGLGLLRNRKR